MADSRLFQPLKVGNATLAHRIAMAPLTRFRADDNHIPTDMMVTYYEQRASVPGTLLVTEATFLSLTAGGYTNVPGIYNPEQIAAWRKVTDAVHAKGSYIFCQLWSLGRAGRPEVAEAEGYKIHSASDVPIDADHAVPVPMTLDEIRVRIQEYAIAAKNAVEAGFDGVEIHGANGYLVDQFIQDVSNVRDDEYGGSIEKRSRFAVEVVQAVVDAVGAERTAIRLSPWTTFQSMRMKDPVPQFSDVLRKISKFNLAYIHFVQSTIEGNREVLASAGESLDFALDIWKGPTLIAGGLDAEKVKTMVNEDYARENVVAVFGKYFISTPDLPFRVREGIELNPYDQETFYFRKSPKGYIDQPFSKEFEALHGPQGVLEQANL